MEIREPTPDECTVNIIIAEDEYCTAYAIWYPSMGGYVGKAVAECRRRGSNPEELIGECIEVHVWHDGEFPFSDSGEDGRKRNPVQLHHCCAEQFVEFGQKLLEFNREGYPHE